MSGVREPKDEEELARARLAILNGKGQTIEQVITDMIDEKPNRELVDAVRNGIKLAQENKEQLQKTRGQLRRDSNFVVPIFRQPTEQKRMAQYMQPASLSSQ